MGSNPDDGEGATATLIHPCGRTVTVTNKRQQQQQQLTQLMGTPLKAPDDMVPYTSHDDLISGRTSLGTPKNLERETHFQPGADRQFHGRTGSKAPEPAGRQGQLPEQYRVPLERADAHEHRAAGVGDVRHELPSTGASCEVLVEIKRRNL